MKLTQFEQAQEIANQLHYLSNIKKAVQNIGESPTILRIGHNGLGFGIEIDINTSRDKTNKANREIMNLIVKLIEANVQSRISELEKEFEAL